MCSKKVIIKKDKKFNYRPKPDAKNEASPPGRENASFSPPGREKKKNERRGRSANEKSPNPGPCNHCGLKGT